MKVLAAKVLTVLGFISAVSLTTAMIGFVTFDGTDLLPLAIASVALVFFILHWMAFLIIVADLIHQRRRAR